MVQNPRCGDMVLGFVPSKYQQDIFNWVDTGRGNAVVEAVAGSGKSTTLIRAARRINGKRVLFCAFNAHIAKHLKEQLGQTVECKTIHSIGFRCVRDYLRDAKLDEDKYWKIAKFYAQSVYTELDREYLEDMNKWSMSDREDPEPQEPSTEEIIAGSLKKLAQFCQITLTDANDRFAVEEMIEHFGIELEDSLDRLLPFVQSILVEGEEIARSSRLIEYSDMLWLPHKWHLQPKYRFDIVFVDEAQDLNKAQLELVLKCVRPGGRFLFVGDSQQAIYGFSGASHDSLEQIVKRTGAQKFPLSICYRCPKTHLEKAKKIVPHIESAPNAAQGVLEVIKLNCLSQVIKEGDLVISRRTAPLLKLCIELISLRIHAKVIGRDLGKFLIKIIEKVENQKGFEFRRFKDFLEEYSYSQIAKLREQRNSASKIESFKDRIKGIRICYESFNSSRIEQLCAEIESLFSEDRPKVSLATIHRAKGLEERRVFLLKPQDLPLRWKDQQDWELQQELNIKYVALTRSKETLYIVEDEESWKQLSEDKIIVDSNSQVTPHQSPSKNRIEELAQPRPYDVVLSPESILSENSREQI